MDKEGPVCPFTVGEVRKQPQCSPADDWVQKARCTHAPAHTRGTPVQLRKGHLAICCVDERGGHYAK